MQFKYNESRVTIPPGWCRNTLKHKLIKASRLGQRERHVLLLVLDQSPTFVLTRSWICSAAGLTARTWPNVMKNLVTAKLLDASSERTPKKYTIWRLFFDLGPLADGDFEDRDADTGDLEAVQSYQQQNSKRGDHASARDAAERGVSRDPHVLQVSCDPTSRGVSTPPILGTSNAIPPPREARRRGGGDFESLRAAACTDQRRILDALVENPKGVAHFDAWRMALARKAVAGELTESNALANSNRQPTRKDKAMVGWWAEDLAYGRLQVTQDLQFHSVKSGIALLLTDNEADQVWRRINRGELNLRPPS